LFFGCRCDTQTIHKGGWIYIMANRYRGGMYVERHEEIERAIARERLVKKWRREWKFALVEADNPEWDDLWKQWFGSGAQEG
jgi:putative endonuclease